MKKVGDIRKELVSLGVAEDIVDSIKGKKNLVEFYEKTLKENGIDEINEVTGILTTASSEDLDDSESVFIKCDAEFKAPHNIFTGPAMEENMAAIGFAKASAENAGEYTHEKVMSLFKDDELENGMPKVNGLRRVAALVIGNICDESVTLTPVEFSGFKDGIKVEFSGMAVIFKISFCCKDEQWGKIGDTISFSDAADCLFGYNTKNDSYGKYITALATTRAEARVLRKALRLNTIAMEEIDEEKVIVDATQINTNSISEAQRMAIEVGCSNKGISVQDVLKEIGKESIEALTKDDFRDMMKVIEKAKISKQDKEGK